MQYTEIIEAKNRYASYPVEFGKIKYTADENGDYVCEIEFKCFVNKENFEDFKNELKELLKKYTI